MSLNSELRKICSLDKFHTPPNPNYLIDSKVSESGQSYSSPTIPLPLQCNGNGIDLHSFKNETRQFTTKNVENLLMAAVTAVTPDHAKNTMDLRADK